MKKKEIKNQLQENLRKFEKELFSHKQSGDEAIEQKNKYDKLVDELASNYKEVLDSNPDVLSFTCPHCKRKQCKIGQEQTGYVSYEYNLTSGEFVKDKDFQPITNDSTNFFCLDCGTAITKETIRNEFPKRVSEDLQLYF